jgi:hypothetical protein
MNVAGITGEPKAGGFFRYGPRAVYWALPLDRKTPEGYIWLIKINGGYVIEKNESF